MAALLATGPAALLAGPSCDVSALRGVVSSAPLPQLGLELIVADSLLPGAGRGLFACTTSAGAALLPSGTPLCGLAEGAFEAQARGDSAVPFEFTGAEQLVLHEGSLQSLEALLRSAPEAGLFAHRVLRYGPPGMGGLLVSNAPGPDLPAPSRVFIPRPPQREPPSVLQLHEFGQFANDLAYEPGLLDRDDALWAYESASAERARRCTSWHSDRSSPRAQRRTRQAVAVVGEPAAAHRRVRRGRRNPLALFWSVRLEAPADGEASGGEPAESEWAPERVWCVAQRDVALPPAAGVACELGVTYGIDYWRRREIGR